MIELLKNEDNGEEISRLITLDTKQENHTITGRTYDGKWHIQQIGEPAVSYLIVAHVDEAGKAALLHAESEISLLSAALSYGKFYGRITEMSWKKIIRGLYVATITLAKEDT